MWCNYGMDPATASLLPIFAWIAFCLLTLLAVLLGLLLTYHWFRYAMNNAAALTSLVIYSTITFLLVSGLLAATIAVTARL